MEFNCRFKELNIYIYTHTHTKLSKTFCAPDDFIVIIVSGDYLITLFSSSVRDGTAVNKLTGRGMKYWALDSGNLQLFPDRLCGPATLLSNRYTKWRTEGGVSELKPSPEISKGIQNRAKLNPICENC